MAILYTETFQARQGVGAPPHPGPSPAAARAVTSPDS